MGDRCYLQITLRREDLDRFGEILNEQAGSTWWDEEIDEPAPGIVEVAVSEANYGWCDSREAAAQAGIPFLGTHGDGGSYSGCAFVSLDREHVEVNTDRDGCMCVQIDESMRFLSGLEYIRAYLRKQRAVRALFGLKSGPDEHFAPEPEEEELSEHYLLHVIGDIDPQLLGPYVSAEDRDSQAVELRHRCGDEDGLYRLDMTTDGQPSVGPYTNCELESENEQLTCGICGDAVCIDDLRDHLRQHNPNAGDLEWEQIRRVFAA